MQEGILCTGNWYLTAWWLLERALQSPALGSGGAFSDQGPSWGTKSCAGFVPRPHLPWAAPFNDCMKADPIPPLDPVLFLLTQACPRMKPLYS